MDIRTKRLVLRAMTPEDAPWIARDIANPKVQQWLTAPPHPYLLDHAHDFVQRHREDELYRVVEFNDVGVGVVSITRQDDGIADLGYWLAETAWGQGLMTEAATALTAHYVRTYEHTLMSGWITGNAGSRNVLIKLGFERHGELQTQCHFRGGIVTVEKVILPKARWQTLSALGE